MASEFFPAAVAGFTREGPDNPSSNYQLYRRPGGRGLGFEPGWKELDPRDQSVGFVTKADLEAGLRRVRAVESAETDGGLIIYPAEAVLAAE